MKRNDCELRQHGAGDRIRTDDEFIHRHEGQNMEYSLMYHGKVLDANNLKPFKETRPAPFRVMLGEAFSLCEIVSGRHKDNVQSLTALKSLTVGELAEHINHGCTFSPAVQEDGKWKYQDIVIIEFYKQEYTMHEYVDYALDMCDVSPVMIVPMRPGCLDSDRFYFVFINSTPIEDLNTLRRCEENLCRIFPFADPSPKDPNRFYTGPHDFVYVGEYYTVDLLAL